MSDTPEAPQPHKRRVRYAGKHPRRFDQKYKELDPAKYAEFANGSLNAVTDLLAAQLKATAQQR